VEWASALEAGFEEVRAELLGVLENKRKMEK